MQLSFEQLLAAINQLPLAEQLELKKYLDHQHKNKSLPVRNGGRKKTNGKSATDEADLIAQTKITLPPTELRRFKKLIAKSERGTLTTVELEEYKKLAKRSQAQDVKRVEALAKLAQMRGQPVDVVMKQIGWRSGSDET